MEVKNFIHASAIALLFSACDKGGGSFSVLSESSMYEQKAVYVSRKLDVLFVVDNSGSMQTSQNNLVNNFGSFIDRFIAKGYDFRIAVTTTEAYRYPQFGYNNCWNGSYNGSRCTADLTKFRTGTTPAIYVIDGADYNLSLTTEKDKLKNDFKLNALVGVNGSGDERGLSSFHYALNDTQNAGFHRPDAFLSVVILSDEEDRSQPTYVDGGTSSFYPVGDFKSSLETFTNGQATNDFSVSVITVLDEACRASLNSGQSIGNRYMEIADLTGGTKNSICAPFDTSLDRISASIEAQGSAEFQLPKAALVSSIRLLVDGKLVPQSNTEGWTYVPSTKVVRINGAVYKPANGATVKLNYDPDLANP